MRSSARRRMETAFFSSLVISAKLLLKPSGIKIGSHPNPPLPPDSFGNRSFNLSNEHMSFVAVEETDRRFATARRFSTPASIFRSPSLPTVSKNHLISAPGSPFHARNSKCGVLDENKFASLAKGIFCLLADNFSNIKTLWLVEIHCNLLKTAIEYFVHLAEFVYILCCEKFRIHIQNSIISRAFGNSRDYCSATIRNMPKDTLCRFLFFTIIIDDDKIVERAACNVVGSSRRRFAISSSAMPLPRSR